MLIVRPISVGSARYYYRGPDPGHWLGIGAASLGLRGIPAPEALTAVLSGSDPRSGTRLGHAHPHRRAGWDLIFAAPKSVSLLAALADPPDGRAISAAHRRAVAETMDWMGAEATWARRDGQKVATDGMIAAGFEHGNSAAGDPHLHTHILMANLVRGPDRRWSALDASSFYRDRLTLGALYQLALRRELATTGIDLPWVIGPSGLADLAGVPRDALDAVSARRQQVRADLATDGDPDGQPEPAGPSTRRTHLAAVRTRTLDPGTGWRERLAAVGFGTSQVSALLGPVRLAAEDVTHLDRTTAAAAEEWLARGASTWSRSDAIRSLAATWPGGALPRTAAGLAQELCERAQPAGPDRWTTAAARSLDQAVLDAAGIRTVGRAVATQAAIDDALSDRPQLSAEQRALARHLVSSGHGVEVVPGTPGRARFVDQAAVLDAARAAWQAGGARVVVDTEPGQSSRWAALTALRPPGTSAPTVVVIDRADRRPSPELASILERAAAAHTKVVLVAGGTLPALRHPRSAAVESLIRPGADIGAESGWAGPRMHQPVVTRSGPILVCGSAADALDTVIGRWCSLPPAQRPRLVGLGRAEVEVLNSLARHRLRAAGIIGMDEVVVGGRPYAVGDRVMVTRRGPAPVGTAGTVTAISHRPTTLAVRWDQPDPEARHPDPPHPGPPHPGPPHPGPPHPGPPHPGPPHPGPPSDPAELRDPVVVPAWDAQRLVHGYATTPRLATHQRGPALILGDPRATPSQLARDAVGIVVAPVSARERNPVDRLTRLAMTSPADLRSLPQPSSPPPAFPHRVEERQDAVHAAPASPSKDPTPYLSASPHASLVQLDERREELGAELRATLPPDVAGDRLRLAEDRAFYWSRPGGPTDADRRDVSVRSWHLQQAEAALDDWIAAHAVDLAEWRNLQRRLDRQADQVAYAATVDPGSAARQVAGPEPDLDADRWRWEWAIRHFAIHAERWPEWSDALQPGAGGRGDGAEGTSITRAASISRRRRDRALQDLERTLGRGYGTAVGRDTGLGL